jgi:hypothetical protein
MTGSYEVRFSDPSKLDAIIVPAMPPGINTVDTSLSLVGRGYPNYGQKIAENFLHLLENFSSALPPENPVEGQLWYDTSDPNKKVLRIMDGTSSSTRWPSANGIYQQGTDPMLESFVSLNIGDIWVDTANTQLKIFNSNDWVTVGPITGGAEITGPVVESIEDTTGTYHRVIVNYVNGDSSVAAKSGAIAIISDTAFTPKMVIPGFSRIVAGVNLSSLASSIFNGTAQAAKNLITTANETVSADLFLRKDDQTPYGQLVTGRVVFQTPDLDETGGQGVNGVVVTTDSTTFSTKYVQFYKAGTNAVILNNEPDGKVVIKTRTATSVPTNTLEIGTDLIRANSDVLVTKNFSVSSTATFSSNVSVTNLLTVASTATFSDVVVTGKIFNTNTLELGSATGSGTIITPAVTNAYNIGSSSRVFDRVYANSFGTGNSIFYGSLMGSASGLTNASTFSITGHVRTVSDVNYNGQAGSVSFNTTLHPSAISNQSEITTASSSLQLLVLDSSNSNLYKINKDNFLSKTTPTGMITAYGSNQNLPTGWLLCNGQQLLRFADYEELFSVIGYSYGGSEGSGTFALPNLTVQTTDSKTVYFIIKA